jgi:eukaryotic-like serine/threonine-protein kinase
MTRQTTDAEKGGEPADLGETTEYVLSSDTPTEEAAPEEKEDTGELLKIAEGPIPPVASAPAPGRPPVRKLSVLGDYRLVAKLGEGGMGAVYKARHISRPQEAALKVLSREKASQPGFVQRFQREGRLMARLVHPHIVRCYALGESHGFHYLAMEFLSGGSLQTWLDRSGKFSLGDALHIVLVCARALKFAHEQSLIHRDVKPDNLLLSAKGVVKLADLGLAKAADEDLDLTKTGIGIGTPLYAPPEQIRGAKNADARSDLYALGCVLYHFLTGRLPFEGSHFLAVIQAKEKGVFPPARRFNPEVSDKVETILIRLLARLPEQRYQSAAELIQDLERLGKARSSLSFLANKPSAE